MPSGSVEPDDSTILDSVGREVFEETGLRLTRFTRQVGEGARHRSQRRGLEVFKLVFRVEVAGVPTHMTTGGSLPVCSDNCQTSDGEPGEVSRLENVPAILNTPEHQNYK